MIEEFQQEIVCGKVGFHEGGIALCPFGEQRAQVCPEPSSKDATGCKLLSDVESCLQLVFPADLGGGEDVHPIVGDRDEVQQPQQPELDARVLDAHDLGFRERAEACVLKQEGALGGGELCGVHVASLTY